MKHTRIILLLALSVGLSSSTTYTKDSEVVEALSEVKKHYANADNLSMHIMLDVVSKKGQNQAQNQRFEGVVYQSGKRYYSNLMNRSTLVNERCHVLVDRQQKMIIYQPLEPREEEMPRKKRRRKKIEGLEQLDVDPGFWKLISKSDDEMILAWEEPMPDVAKIEMTLDLKNHTLVKLVYHYTAYVDQPYDLMEINYSDIQLNKPIEAGIFSESKFVTGHGTTAQAAFEYAGYEFINQSNPHVR